jgi:multiple sugar transport system substrate-binding protein
MVPEPEATDAYDEWASLIKEFERQNADIRIQLKRQDNSSEPQKLNVDALQKGDYDLAYIDIIWVPKFAEEGLLKNLSDQISNEELEKFLPSDVNGGRYQGGLYRIPFHTDVGVLYYRKDLLEKAKFSPPITFTELRETAQTLQKQKVAEWGYVWQGQQYEGLVAMFVEVLQGYGGFWIDPIGNVGLDQQQAVDAVKFLRSTIEQGISPPDVTDYQEKQAQELFLQGKAVFLRHWPNVWALAKDSRVRGKIAIKPMVHTLDNSSGACKGGWGFGISAKTRHPDAAWKAIDFFTSAAQQRQFVLNTGYLPSRRSLFIDPQIVDRYSHFPKLLEVIENSLLRPPIPQYDEASKILQQHLSEALRGQQSPETAMKQAAQETRQRLARRYN